MVVTKAANKVAAKAKPGTTVAKRTIDKDLVSNMACGFRNLMKYRASEACRKAAEWAHESITTDGPPLPGTG